MVGISQLSFCAGFICSIVYHPDVQNVSRINHLYYIWDQNYAFWQYLTALNWLSCHWHDSSTIWFFRAQTLNSSFMASMSTNFQWQDTGFIQWRIVSHDDYDNDIRHRYHFSFCLYGFKEENSRNVKLGKMIKIKACFVARNFISKLRKFYSGFFFPSVTAPNSR